MLQKTLVGITFMISYVILNAWFPIDVILGKYSGGFPSSVLVVCFPVEA